MTLLARKKNVSGVFDLQWELDQAFLHLPAIKKITLRLKRQRQLMVYRQITGFTDDSFFSNDYQKPRQWEIDRWQSSRLHFTWYPTNVIPLLWKQVQVEILKIQVGLINIERGIEYDWKVIPLSFSSDWWFSEAFAPDSGREKSQLPPSSSSLSILT